jgi:prepilin-type N-terminal cleavage/methylation domain-containing protein
MPEKALTLVEMVISLAITAVLTAIALVSLNFVSGRELDIQARNLVSDLTWARESVVSTHYNYTIAFDTNNETYSLYNGTVAPANLIKTQKLTVELVNVTNWTYAPKTNFIFYYPGGNASIPVLINLRQTGRSRRLNISDQTGFIRVE